MNHQKTKLHLLNLVLSSWVIIIWVFRVFRAIPNTSQPFGRNGRYFQTPRFHRSFAFLSRDRCDTIYFFRQEFINYTYQNTACLAKIGSPILFYFLYFIIKLSFIIKTLKPNQSSGKEIKSLNCPTYLHHWVGSMPIQLQAAWVIVIAGWMLSSVLGGSSKTFKIILTWPEFGKFKPQVIFRMCLSSK